MENICREIEIRRVLKKLSKLEEQQAFYRRQIKIAIHERKVSDIQDLSRAIRDMRRRPYGLRDLNEQIRFLYSTH